MDSILGVWPLPLNLVFVRFKHVVINHSSLLHSIPLCKNILQSSMQSAVDGRLDCFQFHAFMKSAAMNILIRVFG